MMPLSQQHSFSCHYCGRALKGTRKDSVIWTFPGGEGRLVCKGCAEARAE